MQTPFRVSKQPKKEMDAEMPKRGEKRKSKEKKMAKKTDNRDIPHFYMYIFVFMYSELKVASPRYMTLLAIFL